MRPDGCWTRSRPEAAFDHLPSLATSTSTRSVRGRSVTATGRPDDEPDDETHSASPPASAGQSCPSQPVRRPRAETWRHRHHLSEPHPRGCDQRIASFGFEVDEGSRRRRRDVVGRHRRPCGLDGRLERQGRLCTDRDATALDRRPSILESLAHHDRQLGRFRDTQDRAALRRHEPCERRHVGIGSYAECDQFDPRSRQSRLERRIRLLVHEAIGDEHDDAPLRRRRFELRNSSFQRWSDASASLRLGRPGPRHCLAERLRSL